MRSIHSVPDCGCDISPEADGKQFGVSKYEMSMYPTMSLLLQTGPLDLLRGLALPVILMVIFYVILFLPAQRRQKKTQEMLSALKSGDKVLTSGGIYGTIVGIESDAVQVRIADQVKVRVARSAITDKVPDTKES